jgi:hypothetical protein
MCLVFRAREATKDIDALLVPAAELRRAARRVGEREGLEDGWLNDAVKGFFSASGRFDVYQEFSHLTVFAPHPEYLLAMKCLAMRLGEGFQDRNDVAVLLNVLGMKRLEEVRACSRATSHRSAIRFAHGVSSQIYLETRPTTSACQRLFAPKASQCFRSPIH